MGVFWLSFALNFLDRQLLAAVAPDLKAEFSLNNAQYGQLVSSFYFVYAISTPLAGLFIDRAGLRAGAAIAVAFWSVAGAATSAVTSFRGLHACRMGLGMGESAGFPALAKATAAYLNPAEAGLAGGFGAGSIALGSIAAPVVAAAMAPMYGWRSTFLVSGVLGLMWIPLWLWTTRRIPQRVQAAAAQSSASHRPLRDGRLWTVALAYCLTYAVYTLWANWTTIFLVEEHHLSQAEANARFAWLPPVFAVLGGFLGGGLAFRWIRGSMAPLRARMRACWCTAPLLLAGFLVPFLPGTALAVAAIGVSFLAFQSILGSLFLIPIDLFGERPAGLCGSLLGFAAAGTQVVAAPIIGTLVDRAGFTLLCLVVPLLPLCGLMVLQIALGGAPAGPWQRRAQ